MVIGEPPRAGGTGTRIGKGKARVGRRGCSPRRPSVNDRDRDETPLERGERHVAEGEARIARQKEIIRCLDCTKQFNERSSGLLVSVAVEALTTVLVAMALPADLPMRAMPALRSMAMSLRWMAAAAVAAASAIWV